MTTCLCEYVSVGHKAHRTVYVLNGENQPFQFFIKETSRYSEAFLDSLQLEPLEGVVPPKDRCVPQLHR